MAMSSPSTASMAATLSLPMAGARAMSASSVNRCSSFINFNGGRTRTATVSRFVPSKCRSRMMMISCDVALKPDSTTSSSSESSEEESASNKVGAKVRVKVPLKVYHVPKLAEVDLTGMEGVIKQYVGLWKGKRISANFPFKVEFVITNIEGRGPVKFFAHLKEDEFEYL